MCDLKKLSGFLIAGQLIYLAIIVAMGVAVFNSTSGVLAPLNGFVMAGVIVAAGFATGSFALALVEANKCATGRCGGVLEPFASWLTGLIASMGILTGLLIGLAVVAPLPGVGAAAVLVVVKWCMALTVGLNIVVHGWMSRKFREYMDCMAEPDTAALGPVSEAIGWVTGALSALVLGGAVYKGLIPGSDKLLSALFPK